jgi:hypothetical protein
MIDEESPDDGGMPSHCSGCAKFVRDGAGNQEIRGEQLLRFCVRCWSKECNKVGTVPAEA